MVYFPSVIMPSFGCMVFFFRKSQSIEQIRLHCPFPKKPGPAIEIYTPVKSMHLFPIDLYVSLLGIAFNELAPCFIK